MKTGHASGFQVAFLSFGVMLLAVPFSSAVGRVAGLDGTYLFFVEKGGHFLLGAALILAVGPLRRAATGMLSAPIPQNMRVECLGAWLLMQAAAFGGVAALALWFIAQEGPGWTAHM